ncbi:MAG: lysophospholipid acyltransferase family protein [Gemmatimonadales bacterium]
MNDYERRRLRPPTVSHRLEYFAMRSLIGGLRRVPWDTACAIGERLGELLYRPLRIREFVVERQIAGAFPELDEKAVKNLARASYRHLGRTAVEAALLPTMDSASLIGLVEVVEGWDQIVTRADPGKGTLLVSGHHGNWELLAGYLAARGLPTEVIVRGADNRLFEDYLNDNRSRLGLEVVHDAGAVRSITKAMRGGRYVAMLADQGVLGLASSFVPFFKRPAKTPRGFAVFALRFDVPVYFMDMLRLPSGKFRVVFEPVQIDRTGDKDRDTDAMVAEYSRILEKWVREYPEQYFWQHRRWRRQPEGTPPELRDPALRDPSAWTPSR